MSISATMTTTAPPAPRSGTKDEIDRLLAAIGDGDRTAADELVDLSYHRVYCQLHRLTGGDRELASDLTQETYRKAWVSLAGFEGRSSFSTWLFRIAYTTFLNHIRRPRPVLALEEAGPLPGPSDAEHGEEGLAAAEDRERVRRAVLALPETLRLTVAARFWGEIPVREIARLEGISEPAVRKRLKKAMRRLSDDLAEVIS